MRRFQSIRMTLGILAIGLMATTALAQPAHFSPGGNDTPAILSDNGFIFVDGEYFSPPYKIEAEEQGFKINGREFKLESFDLSSYKAHGSGMWGHPGMFQGRRGERPGQNGLNRETPQDPEAAAAADAQAAVVAAKHATRRLFQEFGALGHGSMVFLRSDAKPFVTTDQQVQHELLKQLLVISGTQTRAAVIPEVVGDEADRETWNQLIDTFQPTPSFIERATQQVDLVNELQSEIAAQLVYRQWSEDLIYPLTMLALVLVVVGLGHLMGSAHEVFSVTLNREEANGLSKNVIRLLVIMALMSAIDLIWTVMAHQNGSMRELNPLGSKLIDDTSQLIAFKLFVTGLSIGLLFWLRRLPLTRKATWWCCLTMTLLTVRWLSFHSMLV